MQARRFGRGPTRTPLFAVFLLALLGLASIFLDTVSPVVVVALAVLAGGLTAVLHAWGDVHADLRRAVAVAPPSPTEEGGGVLGDEWEEGLSPAGRTLTLRDPLTGAPRRVLLVGGGGPGSLSLDLINARLMLSNRDFTAEDYAALLRLDDAPTVASVMAAADITEVNQLPPPFQYVVGHAGKGGGDAPSCVICLEDFGDGEWVRYLPCTHLFHRDCVTPWLLTKAVCPTCLTSIREG